jgi:Tfp pilus assembly protein PilN
MVLDQLAQATPSGVALTRFKQEGERYILSGHALSSDVLQRFEQNLRQIAEWRHIERQSARSSMMNQRPVLSFTLQALPLVKAAP